MTATAAPFGFEPAYQLGGNVIPDGVFNGIASGYASNIYLGDPISYNTSGNIIIGTTTGAITGVFAGCTYKTASGLTVSFGNWPASTTYQTGTMVAYIFRDPEIEYRVQANGSVAQTAVGDQANTVNPGTGNDYTRLSSSALNSSLAGASSTGQWIVVGLEERPDNAWADAFTIVRVKLNQAQLGPASVVAI